MTREEAIRAVGQATKRIGLLHHVEPFVDALEAVGVLKLDLPPKTAREVIANVTADEPFVRKRHSEAWEYTTHVLGEAYAHRIVLALDFHGYKIVRK